MRSLQLLSLLLLVGCPSADDTANPDDTQDSDQPEDTDETDGPDDSGETGEPASCVPNGDGRIEWSEFVADPSLGINAIYTTNSPGSTATVPAVGGVEQDDGSYAWDFSATDGGTDTQWTIALGVPQDAWFADRFPDATYTVGLDASEEILGVYRVNDSAERLELLGMATAEQADGGVLVYEQPVVVFDFPLVVGNRWDNEQVQADGHWDGEDYPADFGWHGTVTLHHSYRFEVDRAGSLEAPMGGFEVLRLRADQRMEAVNSLYGGFAEETLISYFYVAECTGLVARVRSVADERDPDFTQASEYLRLGF
jgi:hypothetical protein